MQIRQHVGQREVQQRTAEALATKRPWQEQQRCRQQHKLEQQHRQRDAPQVFGTRKKPANMPVELEQQLRQRERRERIDTSRQWLASLGVLSDLELLVRVGRVVDPSDEGRHRTLSEASREPSEAIRPKSGTSQAPTSRCQPLERRMRP